MNKKGFTLLEVILFLAISSSLALVAFVGLGPRLRNVRFTDSVRGLESNIQRATADSEKGGSLRQVNKKCSQDPVWKTVKIEDGTQGPGSASDCVIAGRFVYFEDKRAIIRDVVAFRKPLGCSTQPTESLDSLLNCYRPQIVDINTTFYNYTNGMEAYHNQKTAFGVIKNPETNKNYIIQLNKTGTYAGFFSGTISSISGFNWREDYETPVCFRLGSRNARLVFTESSMKPSVEFEVTEGCS